MYVCTMYQCIKVSKTHHIVDNHRRNQLFAKMELMGFPNIHYMYDIVMSLALRDAIEFALLFIELCLSYMTVLLTTGKI